jgi:hypothetical protein
MAVVAIEAHELTETAVFRTGRRHDVLVIIYLHHIVAVGVGLNHLTNAAAASLRL